MNISKVKSVLVLASAVCGLQLSAATPVAVWDGDFSSLTRGAYTWTASAGTTVAADMVTIGSDGGLTMTVPTTSTIYSSYTVTVIMDAEVPNFTAESPLVDIYANGSYVTLTSEGTTLRQRWNFGGSYGSYTWTPGRQKIAVTYKASNPPGTRSFVNGANVMAAAGLFSSAGNLKTLKLGCYAKDSTTKVAAGLKIYKVAIFDTNISDDEVSAYKWPTELDKMYSNRLSGGTVTVAPGEYGAITVPGAGYKATAVTSWADLSNTASGEEITGSHANIIQKVSGNGDVRSHTLSGWFCPNSLSAETMLWWAYSKGFTTYNNNGYKVSVTTDRKIKIVRTSQNAADNGTAIYSTEAVMSAGTWAHVAVAMTWGGSGNRKLTPVLYVNGVKKTLTSGTIASDVSGGENGATVRIGAGVSAAGIYVDNTALYDGSAVVNAAKGYVVQASFVGTVTQDTSWANLTWSPYVPPAGADVTIINNGADGVTTVMLADNVSVGKLTVESAAGKELKFANFATKMTATSYDFSKAPGGVGLDVSAGYAVEGENPLRRYIRDNNVKVTFYGSGEKGVSIVNGYDLNRAIQGHWVFNGGKHSMTYGNSVENATVFGANASLDNPTILVKSGTTLDFKGKDLCGWSGAADMNGVIKVEDGGRINMKDDSSTVDGGTVYYRQRIALNPGAEFYVDMAANNFRLQGGTESGKEQLYVPAGSGTAYIKPADASRDSIYLAKDETRGFGVFVGEGSTLDIQTKIACQEDSDNQNNFEIAKRGTGTLKLSGDISGYWNRNYEGKVVKFSVYAGDMELAMAEAVRCQIWFQNGSNLRLTGNGTRISGYLDGPGKVVCNTTGEVVLSGANNYSGGTDILSGVLVLGNDSALGTGKVTIASDAQLDLNGKTVTISSLSGNGTICNSSDNKASVNGIPLSKGKSVSLSDGKIRIVLGASETLALSALPANGTVKIGGAGRVEYTTSGTNPAYPTWTWIADGDDAWKGTYALSGFTTATTQACGSTGWDPTSYYNGNKSKFEFNGTVSSGWFWQPNAKDSLFGELVLNGSIRFDNGHTHPTGSESASIIHYCFTKLSGSGNFSMDTSSSASPVVMFADVSDYAGTISVASSNGDGHGYCVTLGDGYLSTPAEAAIHLAGHVALDTLTLSAKNGVKIADDASLVFADKDSKLTVNSAVAVNSGVTIPVKIENAAGLTAGTALITWTGTAPAGNFSLEASGVAVGEKGFKATKGSNALTVAEDAATTYYAVGDIESGTVTTVTFEDAWLVGAGVKETGSSTVEVQANLNAENANGIKMSDVYLMGYEAGEAQNAAVILKPDQAQSNGESISLSVAGVPEKTRNGAVITYTALADANRNWEHPTVEAAMGAGRSVSMALPTSGVLYYRIQANVALP